MHRQNVPPPSNFCTRGKSHHHHHHRRFVGIGPFVLRVIQRRCGGGNKKHHLYTDLISLSPILPFSYAYGSVMIRSVISGFFFFVCPFFFRGGGGGGAISPRLMRHRGRDKV